MNRTEARVILSVTTGESVLAKREFSCGSRVEPFSVGGSGDWAISAPGVEPIQLFLAFDGAHVHVASASAAHAVSIDGVLVRNEWTPVAAPSLLTFGGASIAIHREEAGQGTAAPIRPRPIVDLSRPDRQPTQVMDLSRTLQLHTMRMEISESMLAELRNAPPPESVGQAMPAPTTDFPLASGDTLIFRADATQPLAHAQTLQLDLQRTPHVAELVNTLYDGGALRERAAVLASAAPHEVEAPVVQSVAVATPMPASGMLRRNLAAFRRSSLPKQLTLALLPLTIAGVWVMADGSAPAADTHTTRQARTPSRPAAGPIDNTAQVHSAPNAADKAVKARPEDPAPSARMAAAAAVPETVAPHDPSERLALIAAFSGNKADAAALYERLATTRNSRVFALAARLIRDDRVRKP